MQQNVILANVKVMSFIIAVVLLGFLSVGLAAAATLEQKSGMWVNKDYQVKGEWSIEERGDQQVITFNKQFKTKKGPDLKIFLSKQSINTVTGATATNDAILVSALKNNKGEQEYVLPEGVNISDYTSLLIHCEAFGVLWGGADF